LRTHTHIVDFFKDNEKKEVLFVTSGNKPQTFVSILLALRVVHDLDSAASYLIHKQYEAFLKSSSKILEIEVVKYKEMCELLQKQKDALRNSTPALKLSHSGPYMYAFSCNTGTKFGTSYVNKDGQRLKAHKISVVQLQVGFILFASKEDLQFLNLSIKKKFKLVTVEHLYCDVNTLERFLLEFITLMDIKYVLETKHALSLINIDLNTKVPD